MADPYPADDFHLGGYRDLLAAEQRGTLQPGQADALARGRQGGMFALLDQALQSQAPPATPPVGSPAFVNAPVATMDNPEQGAADQQSFNPLANLLPNPTYRPYDMGLADRLGLPPLVPVDPVTKRTPTGVNAPDLTGQGYNSNWVSGEFPARLLAAVQQAPRALQEHPLTTTARVLGSTLGLPGSIAGAAAEENQGSNVGNAVAGGVDLANSFVNYPGKLVTDPLLNALLAGAQGGRGLYRLFQMLRNIPSQNTPQTPPAAPPTQGPLPPTGPQSPYYVPPGTTYH